VRLWPLALLVLACEPPVPTGPVSTHVGDWRDEVIYQIVVDRFDDGDPTNDDVDGVGVDPSDLARFQGGDWRGVRDRLGYLERLGATTATGPPTSRRRIRASVLSRSSVCSSRKRTIEACS